MTENEKKADALWDALGEPLNIEAAVMDGLEWLRFLAVHMPNVFSETAARREMPRLQDAIMALERFVPESEKDTSARVLAETLRGDV